MFRILLATLLLTTAPALAETRVPTSQTEISLGFAPLVKRAAPAVVNIYASRVVQTRSSPFADDPFFQQFFQGMGQSRPRVQNSLGSGVILSDDGYVVSNFHVVGEATDIKVVMTDRREFTASVVLADKEADLAILRLDGPTIDATMLTPLFLMMGAFTLFYIAVLTIRLRAEFVSAKIRNLRVTGAFQ